MNRIKGRVAIGFMASPPDYLMKKPINSSAVEAKAKKSGKKSSTKAADKAGQAKAVEQASAEVEAM